MWPFFIWFGLGLGFFGFSLVGWGFFVVAVVCLFVWLFFDVLLVGGKVGGWVFLLFFVWLGFFKYCDKPVYFPLIIRNRVVCAMDAHTYTATHFWLWLQVCACNL